MAESQALSPRDAQQLSADSQTAGGGGTQMPWQRFLRGAPDMRQIGLIAGIIGAIGLGAGLFLWAQQPSYQTLYAGLSESDRAQVVEALRGGEMDVRVNPDTGAVEVPSGNVHEARIQLAGEGLPEGEGTGFEMLQEDQRFGTSQFMETARFRRALETELGRTVASLSPVENARVHLAVPEDSAFIRENGEPTASVTVKLHGGRSLGDNEVQAIVHMISSSVPRLTEDNVSVVDGSGSLLSNEDDGEGMSGSQFEIRDRLERDYQRRIEDLLTPLVGEGRVKAKVNAEMDFSREERTEEMFNPENTVIRSEQTSEEQGSATELAQGVPGALTNQPPGAGQIGGGDGEGEGEGGNGGFTPDPLNTSNSATRNYEVGRTLRHIQSPGGAVERLTVAVLVDQPRVAGEEEGTTEAEPMSAEEIDRITNLVQDTVGFDEERGDRVNVVDAAFQDTGEAEPVDEPPVWQQPWLQELMRWAIAGLVALALIVFVIRPLVRALVAGSASAGQRGRGEEDSLPPGSAAAEGDHQRLTGPDVESGTIAQKAADAGPDRSQEQIDAAREMVSSDPALAANVIKGWLNDDE